jgi:hypothetical protein
MLLSDCVTIRNMKIYKTRIILYSCKYNYMDWEITISFKFVKQNGMFFIKSKLQRENISPYTIDKLFVLTS